MKRRGNYSTWLVLGVIGTLVAAAALVGNGNIKPTQEVHAQQCHYTAMATGSEELGMNILGPTYLLMQETTEFQAAGPYQGRLEITPDQNTALGATENISCDGAGQQLNLTKGSGPLALYAKNCSIHPGEVAFSITMPDECRRNASPPGISYWGMNMAEGDAPLSVTPNNGNCDCTSQSGGTLGSGSGGSSGGGGNSGGGSKHQVGAGDTASAPSGALDNNLAISYLMGHEKGPYHLTLWWPTVQGARSYRILIEHTQPLRPGASPFPAEGYSVGYSETYRGRMHYTDLGGESYGTFWPGVTVKVRVQAVGEGGNYGPPSGEVRITTHPYAELGAVQNLAASEYASTANPPGFVKVTWTKAPGQHATLWRRFGEGAVILYKKDGEAYSQSRQARMAWDANMSRTPFHATTPRLEPGTRYCFQVTPFRANMPDGEPAETCYTTQTIEAPGAPEITGIERDGAYMDIRWDSDAVFDAVKLKFTSTQGDIDATVDEEGYQYGGYVRWGALPTGRKYCVSIAGVVGAGAGAQQGPFSEEVCEPGA